MKRQRKRERNQFFIVVIIVVGLSLLLCSCESNNSTPETPISTEVEPVQYQPNQLEYWLQQGYEIGGVIASGGEIECVSAFKPMDTHNHLVGMHVFIHYNEKSITTCIGGSSCYDVPDTIYTAWTDLNWVYDDPFLDEYLSWPTHVDYDNMSETFTYTYEEA